VTTVEKACMGATRLGADVQRVVVTQVAVLDCIGDERRLARTSGWGSAGAYAALGTRTGVPRQNRIRPLRGQPFRGNRPGTRGRIPVSCQGMGHGRWKPGPAGARLKRIHCPCSVRERGANPGYSSRLAGPEIVV
jgi:hypothetical protein